MTIPDHPEIARALATGYPGPIHERPIVIPCSGCGAELAEDDLVYDWMGELICETCVKIRMEEDFSIQEIAEAMGIMCREAAQYEEVLT